MTEGVTPFLSPAVQAAVQRLVQAITVEAEAADAAPLSLALAVCCRKGGNAHFDTMICGATEPDLVRKMGDLLLRTATEGGTETDLARPN